MDHWETVIYKCKPVELATVIPLDDLRPHAERTLYCPCNPQIKRVNLKNGPRIVVVHNSFDNREEFENYRMKGSA